MSYAGCHAHLIHLRPRLIIEDASSHSNYEARQASGSSTEGFPRNTAVKDGSWEQTLDLGLFSHTYVHENIHMYMRTILRVRKPYGFYILMHLRAL